MRYFLLASVLGLAAQCGAVMAQDTKPQSGQAFGDWVYQCAPKDATRCALVQTIVAATDKHKLAQLQLVAPKDGAAPLFSVLLPLGLDLQRPVTVAIDGAEAMPIAMKTCLPQGCVGGLALDATIAAAMGKGTSLKVVFSMGSGKQDIGFDGSLKGMGDALAAVSWF